MSVEQWKNTNIRIPGLEVSVTLSIVFFCGVQLRVGLGKVSAKQTAPVWANSATMSARLKIK